MNYINLSKEIWSNYHNIEWELSSFSSKKSYICSLLSQLTYRHIAKYELDQTSRIKLIPSEEYVSNLIQKKTFNVLAELNDMDFRDGFSIESEKLVIVGMKLRNTLFLAIRGTQSLNDGFVDLKVKKSAFAYNEEIKLHRGFYKAILKEYNKIVTTISKFNNCNIYITGHSLGGAIATILFNNLLYDNNFTQISIKNKLSLKSCYTYGMPRFTNKKSINVLTPTFQIYNSNDIVPALPFKWLGYENFPEGYNLSPNKIKKTPNDKKVSFFKFIKLINGKVFREHYIETYSERLKNI